MADPWSAFPVVEQPKASDPWAAFPVVSTGKAPESRWKGSVLPVSEGQDGKPQFDSNAGIVGSLKRAVTLPGRVAAGEIDPKSPDGIDQAMEMAATFSPMNPAVRAGGHAVPGVANGLKPAKVEPPTAQALKDAASKGYDTVRDMGVQYSTDAVTRHVGGLRAALEQDGILGELAPKTFSILNKFDNPPAGSVVTSAGLEAARRAAGNAARDFTNPTEQMAARRFIEALDGFVQAGDPRSVVAGPAAAAAEASTAARANYAAGKRSDKLQGVEERAELQAARANSGFNTDNAVRQRADAIVSKPREAAGFSKEEREALKEIIRGGFVRNTLRTAGNAMGGGGGMGAVVSASAGSGAGAAVGSMIGGPLGLAAGAGIGAAVPALGMAAKGASNRMAMSELGRLDAATRERSPLYLEMLGQAPMTAQNWPVSQMLGRGGSLAALGEMRSSATLEDAYRRLLAEGGA